MIAAWSSLPPLEFHLPSGDVKQGAPSAPCLKILRLCDYPNLLDNNRQEEIKDGTNCDNLAVRDGGTGI